MEYYNRLTDQLITELGDAKVYNDLSARSKALPYKPDARVKLICAGFPRTGTLSMYSALMTLGFKTYHGAELMNPDVSKKWLDVVSQELATGSVDGIAWHEVTKGFEAGLDIPFCEYWRELFAAYPDAKVVYTHRDGNAWFNSIREAIIKPLVEDRLYALAIYWFPQQRQMQKVVRQTFRKCERVYGGLRASLMDERLAEVKKHIPPEQLLVFHPKEGWAPLCTFLDVPISGEPFPNLNDGKSMTMIFTAVTIVGMSIWALVLAVLVGSSLWLYARV